MFATTTAPVKPAPAPTTPTTPAPTRTPFHPPEPGPSVCPVPNPDEQFPQCSTEANIFDGMTLPALPR